MVEGVDYFIEEIPITKKDYDSYYSTEDTAVATVNYFLYYGDDPDKKMQVSEAVYRSYEVNDRIMAYTTDHVYYSFSKEGVLPRLEFRNNELKKAAGVVIGAGLLLLVLYMWLDRR